MKHSVKITLILLGLFLAAQLFGLATVSKYIEVSVNETTGEQEIGHSSTVIGKPPEVKEKSVSFVYLVFGILIGTVLLLILIRHKFNIIWKYWFLLSVWITMAVTFGVYIDYKLAILLAVVLGWWKINRPNVYLHNITEIFIYTGIAIIFVPILNLFSVIVLFILIAAYDYYAVFKSKHMIKMAKFQANQKVFAGMMLPYRMPKLMARGKVKKVKKIKTAILGGGDVAFPLLFSSVVMEHLILNGFGKQAALGLSGIVALTATLSLLALFVLAKKNKFYPAIPFLAAGCFIGLGIVYLVV